MAFKLKSGNSTNFKGMGSSPAKDVKGEDSHGGPLTRDKDGKLTTASKRVQELREEHNRKHSLGEWDVDHKTPEPKSPAKQVSQTAKKVITSGTLGGKDATDFTKGARTKRGGTGTYEKGKKQVYTKQSDDTYTKETSKIKKGATSDKEWESKKTKTISAKKAERQIARKAKKASRSAKRADIKEVRATARTMRKDKGADKKDIRTRKKATIKSIKSR